MSRWKSGYAWLAKVSCARHSSLTTIPSSSLSSRIKLSSGRSPASTLPPGNSQSPAITFPSGRCAMSTRPSESMSAQAATRTVLTLTTCTQPKQGVVKAISTRTESLRQSASQLTGTYRSWRHLTRQFQNCISKRAGRLLRRVVTDPGQDAAPVWPGEQRGMRIRRLGRRDAVGLALQGDRRHGDLRPGGEFLLDRLERRIARRIAETMTIGLNGHVDEIGIVER